MVGGNRHASTYFLSTRIVSVSPRRRLLIVAMQSLKLILQNFLPVFLLKESFQWQQIVRAGNDWVTFV
jgi:hypothetical protein